VNGYLCDAGKAMEVHFTPELEAKLTESAMQKGQDPEDLVVEALSRYFEEEARLLEAVKLGEEALERGEYLTHERVGGRLQPFLQP
jgi:predicted transcriptional regulator